MKTIDLNCDLGEGIGTDELIMPYISSANIACGYHAGDEETIRKTIELCKKYHVAVGAHPSFPDRENFGRTDMHLPGQEIYDLIIKQIALVDKIARKLEVPLHHVKPHGALYNMAARDKFLAPFVALAVKDSDEHLILYGASCSHLISEGKNLGLKTASEVFADRTYNDNGSLTSRSKPGALIEDPDKSISQVLEMINTGVVTTITGKKIAIKAETICIHGDGVHAVEFAKTINETLKNNGISIKYP